MHTYWGWWRLVNKQIRNPFERPISWCVLIGRYVSSIWQLGFFARKTSPLQWITRTFIWLLVDLPIWRIWTPIGMIIPKIWKNRKCSKPPTSYVNVEKHPVIMHGNGKPLMTLSLSLLQSYGKTAGDGPKSIHPCIHPINGGITSTNQLWFRYI